MPTCSGIVPAPGADRFAWPEWPMPATRRAAGWQKGAFQCPSLQPVHRLWQTMDIPAAGSHCGCGNLNSPRGKERSNATSFDRRTGSDGDRNQGMKPLAVVMARPLHVQVVAADGQSQGTLESTTSPRRPLLDIQPVCGAIMAHGRRRHHTGQARGALTPVLLSWLPPPKFSYVYEQLHPSTETAAPAPAGHTDPYQIPRFRLRGRFRARTPAEQVRRRKFQGRSVHGAASLKVILAGVGKSRRSSRNSERRAKGRAVEQPHA